jgi:hypothetical protein
MMKRNGRIVAIVLLLTASTRAQDPAGAGASSNDAGPKLDQKVFNLTIQGEEIEAALADIGKQVGVEIVLDEEAVELLPWGKQTKLSDATISNASLRSVLPQILDALGMTYEVKGEKVVVTATEPLKRLRRRATWDELKLLRSLASTEYSPGAFSSLKIQYRITSKVDAKAMLSQQLEAAGRGTVAEMLETATANLNWVWFVEGDHIVIRTMEAQIANKLARQMTARYTNVPLSQILTELGERSGVVISFEPGIMLKLPPATAQSYTLLLQSVSVRQALELICAETGLKHEIRADGVHMSLSDAAAQESGKSPAPPRTSQYVAKLSVPSAEGGYSLEFLIRSDELPPDILEARSQMLQELIQKVRRDIAPNQPPQPPANPPNR